MKDLFQFLFILYFGKKFVICFRHCSKYQAFLNYTTKRKITGKVIKKHLAVI